MTTQYLEITDEAAWLEKRKNYVTSTEMASLFGIQEGYAPSHFELWHIKRGNLPDTFKDNNYTRFGKLMEEPIAKMVAIDRPEFKIGPMDVFAYDDDCRMGASFDRRVAIADKGIGLLEIKQTDYRTFKHKFTEHVPDDIEAPQGYEVQMQTQLALADDFDFSIMAVFLADVRQLKYIYRKRDDQMASIMRKAAFDFWNGPEPEPDYKMDRSVIAKLAPNADPAKILDGNDNIRLHALCASYKAEKALEKQSAEHAETASAEIMRIMADHKTGWTPGYKITASDIAASEYTVKRQASKRLTITELK